MSEYEQNQREFDSEIPDDVSELGKKEKILQMDRSQSETNLDRPKSIERHQTEKTVNKLES